MSLKKSTALVSFLCLQFVGTAFSQVQNSSDPLLSFQWGLYNHGVPQPIDLDPVKNYRIQAKLGEDAQLYKINMLPAPQKVVVAVLDTGLQKNHPDLKTRLFRKESECRALEKFNQCLTEKDRKTCEAQWMDLNNPEVDQDKNGYPLDCEGWSLLGGINAANIMGRPDFGDDQGHGTHVAGIIGAEVDNAVGIRGASRAALILPVQVLGKQPSEPVKPLSIYDEPAEIGKEGLNKSLGDLVARGVIYAMRSGAQVINFSMGWPQSRDSEYMRKVIAEAQMRGIIIVAAAGNDATGALLRPCAYPGVICVGAHSPDGSLAHFSNFGGGVDLAAPGVNILSTYPESKRPIRYRANVGYEYLSGTSQASPFVAAAAAELLARGIPSEEVMPRLVVGARPASSRLGLLEGTASTGYRDLGILLDVTPRFVMSGNLDVQKSLEATPEPVIVPASKERTEISWDRQTRKIIWNFDLLNRWADGADIHVSGEILNSNLSLLSIKEVAPYERVWLKGELRQFVAELEITDGDKAENSRISSELQLKVDIRTSKRVWSHNLEADIVVPLTDKLQGDDVEVLALTGMPKGRSSFIPIDENLDLENTRRDYLVKIEKNNEWNLTLLRQTNGQYTATGSGKLRVQLQGEDLENIREQYLLRMDWDQNGQSDYVIGLIEDLSQDEKATFSPVTFYVFDDRMQALTSFKYEARLAEMPFEIAWHKTGTHLMPAWVGPGKQTDKTRGLKDRWENPDDYERSEVRFYWLNEKGELKSLQKSGDYKIVDLLEGSPEQKAQGRVPVLLAKNLGTAAKPSYLYDFAMAEIYQGEIQNFMQLGQVGDEKLYRNILDTRVDRLLNLDIDDRAFAGNFWFSEGYEREQRVTLFNNKNLEWMDAQLKAQRYQFDSALWVRAAFVGKKRAGAFVLTNSEIQYHDLMTGRVLGRSMERYTFYPDMLMTNLYFPTLIGDQNAEESRIPALFTTESSQLSRGVKVLAPIFARDGSVVELVSPARLRFVSKAGCRPMDTPVFVGGKTGSAFDYYCGSSILRVHLKL